MQPGPARQPDDTPHHALSPSAAFHPDGRATYTVWNELENLIVHQYEVMGDEHAQHFRKGTTKAVIVLKHEQTHLLAKKIWLSHQDRAFANWLVQMLRERYLWPNRPIRIEVDGTQTAFTETLEGLPVHSLAMQKCVDNTIQPPLTSICILKLMSDEEVSSFHKAMQSRIANWEKSVTIGPENQDQNAEPEVAEHVREMFAQSASTAGHSFLNIINDRGENVGKLWVQREQSSRVFHLKYIEVDPDKRRMGFGKSTVALCESISFQNGFEMRVFITGKNNAAEQLFRSTGFTTVAKSFVMTA